MNNYAYMGAAWGNQAGRNRQQSQNQARAWQQFAPQRNQQTMGRAQLGSQQAMAADNQRSRYTQFGVGALAGLMRR
jgi:hypothetical protein